MALPRTSDTADEPAEVEAPPEAPPAGAEPRLRRRILAVVAFVVAALALVAVSIALVPVTESTPTGPVAPPDTRVGLPVSSRVVITQTTGGTVTVQPSLKTPEVFTTFLVQPGGPFGADNHGLSSITPGSLTLAGTFGDLDLAFAGDPDAAEVTIERTGEGQSQRWVLTRDDLIDGQSVSVPSPLGFSPVSRLYLFQGGDAPTGGVVKVGDDVVPVSSGPYTAADVFPTAARAAIRGWGILLAGVVAVFLCWLVGRAILRPGWARSASHPVPTVPIGLGGGLVLCATSTLSYVVPTRLAAYLVVAAALATLVLGRRRIRAGFGGEVLALGRRVAWVTPASMLAFFPIFYWGLWFAGQYRTDLYEYATMSSIARGNSLFGMRTLAEAQSSGTITSGAGFVWRSLDSVTAGAVSTLTSLPTVPAMALLALVLFLVSAIAVVDLAVGEAPVADHAARVGALVAAIALVNPLLTGLFVEDYFSQYFFVALVPVLVVVLLVAVRQAASAKPLAGLTWTVAGVAAAMIAVYPYFFAVLAVALVLAALLRSDTRRAAVRMLWPLAWRVVLLVNLAWITVARYGETAYVEDALDDIARHLLIPGWGPAQLGSMYAGLQSYQLRDVFPGAELAGPVGPLVEALDWAATPPGWLLVLAAVVVLVLLASVNVRATFSSYAGPAIYLVVLAWIGFCVYYGVSGRPYVMLKSGWVAAALVPALLAVTRFHRVGRWMAPVAVTAIAVTAWVPTALADRATWLLPLGGAYDRGDHVSVAADLDMVDRLVSPGDRVAITIGAEPMRGSDRDRVLLGHLTVLLRDKGAECVNCNGLDWPRPVDCASGQLDAVISVGASEPASTGCGLPEQSGNQIDVYGQ